MDLISIVKQRLKKEIRAIKEEDMLLRQRKQLNVTVDKRVINEAKDLAAQFTVPRYCLIEHLLDQIEKTQKKLDLLRSRVIPNQYIPAVDYQAVKEFLRTLPVKWPSYSRTLRNRLLKRLINHVDIYHQGQTIKATLYWQTGQAEEVIIQRIGLIGHHKHWTRNELATLEKLWPSAAQSELLDALPGRTWKAISDQANKQKWQRTHISSKSAPRKRWQPGEDKEGKLLYEEKVPITDIATKLGKTVSAVRQRASAKGWNRPTIVDKPALLDEKNINENPEVSKRITSGSHPGVMPHYNMQNDVIMA